MKQQTDTATHAALPAASKTTSPTSSAGISPLAAFGLHAGIRTTAAYSAFPATFTEQENSGFLAAILRAKNSAELTQLCSERDIQERTRWQSWWRWHECSRRVREFSPVASEWYIREEDRAEVEYLRSERLSLLINHREWKDQHALDRKIREVSGRLYELTGHPPFKPR
jgi:hypothetical protein